MSDMVKCKCIDEGNTSTLRTNEEYYCFPNGDQYYYVSRFPNKGAHFGCFNKSFFEEVVDSVEPPTFNTDFLDREKVYLAELVFRKKYNSVKLQDYYIRPRKTHCNFFRDPQLMKMEGCFPLHWFTNFREVEFVEPEPVVEEIVEEETPVGQEEQLTLF